MRLARPLTPRDMPLWGWITLAVLTGLILLPVALRLYGLWWDLVFRAGHFVETWMPAR